LIESYKKNDIEVLICDDKEIDEIITSSIGTYKSWHLKTSLCTLFFGADSFIL